MCLWMSLLWNSAAGADPFVPASVQPNIVIYLVDTLRADHLGVYGYRRDTSPNLDRWAQESVLFEQAYSPTSWTRPAMVSLFSGRDAVSHGVEDRLDVIPDDVELLSQRLQQTGYTTYAAVTNPNVLPEWGFARGFDVFEDLGAAGHAATADRVTDFVAKRIDEMVAQQPFLLYLHLIDPHAPYDPPPPYDTRFPSSPALPLKQSIGRYDGEIAYVDDEFGRFTNLLEENDLSQNTLVVFTSDHGEELLDHGGFGHGGNLYEETVRIPLILRMPGAQFAGSHIVSPVSLIDIAPTIMALVGQSMGPDADGRSLLELLPAGPVDLWADRDLFLSLYTTGPQSHSIQGVVSGLHKYLRRSRPTVSEEVFDLSADPREKRNLANRSNSGLTRLSGLLDTHLAENARGIQLRIVSEPEADPQSCEMLLTTSGRFTDVTPVRLEQEDSIELSESAQKLRVTCSLVSRVQELLDGSRPVPDEDGISFRVDPEDATIVVEEITQPPGMPLRIGYISTPTELPHTFQASDSALEIRDVREMISAADAANHPGPGVYIGVIQKPNAARNVSPETIERLRGLGYIHGDDR